MRIDDELKARILRYHFVEHWPVGTIASQLGIHHSTVERVLGEAGVKRERRRARRPSKLDPYIGFITETLECFPTLTAARLFDMVKMRGYCGGPDHFRHRIAQLRPRRPRAAYLRLRTLPGEQAQVDWAHFGKLTIGRAERPLMAFVLVLSYSRYPFVRFSLGASLAHLIRGHVEAFSVLGGSARTVLYDHMKSVVLERRGDAIRFHPTWLELAAHYRFEPRPVAPARGNEKGRVERLIRFVRDSFFRARRFRDLDDLNDQADQWCSTRAAERPCPEDPQRTVAEVQRLRSAPTSSHSPTTPSRARSGSTSKWARPPTYDSMPTITPSPTTASVGPSPSRQPATPCASSTPAPCSPPIAARSTAASRSKTPPTSRRSHATSASAASTAPPTASTMPPRHRRSCSSPPRNATTTSASDQPPPLALDLPDDPRLRTLSVRPHDLAGYDRLNDPSDSGDEDAHRDDDHEPNTHE